MKIIFMGSPEFAVPSLEALIRAGHKVAAVVTQPDKPKGRGKTIEPGPVKQAAQRAGIPVLQPHGLKDQTIVDELKAISPDAIVVVAYGKILPEAILRIAPLGCVNVHASLLPKYRGAAPINRAVINGEKETGVTTMLMDKGMDTGAMLLKEAVLIGEKDTAEGLFKTLSLTGANLLVKTLSLLEKNEIRPAPQDEALATYAPMLKKEDGVINWKKNAVEIRNLIRGVQPWPGAGTGLRGAPVKIHAATVCESDTAYQCAEPGTVIAASGGRIVVKCGSGALEILELQPENKRRMSAAGFLMGYKLSVGERLA